MENSVGFIIYLCFLFLICAFFIGLWCYIGLTEIRQEREFYNSLSEEEKHLIDRYNRAKKFFPKKKEKKVNESK